MGNCDEKSLHPRPEVLDLPLSTRMRLGFSVRFRLGFGNNFSGTVLDKVRWYENNVKTFSDDIMFIVSLPDSLINLVQLKILDFHSNKLWGITKGKVGKK
ncbi:hypothetical protein TSUD_321430 [Trifolium subterraneum]|uniref:Uncharacterized protein n=1 Tax=Trifolium subterraneum TaxID=3900 RepID=A0A2Z6NRK8_TRISU|nr:hypothetical protein TSUD_321430 [Trifolium subterraneum]